MPSSQIERKLAAIMFTAIPDYSSISARDEEEALTLLENQTQALTPIIEEYGGTLHKKLGDGLLISFSTITNAVICASKFQKKAQSIEDLNLQISIHEGEISFKDDDILGKHVNLSALILRYSTVGGVVISDKVYQNISNVPEFETKYICEENFQGFSEKTKMYAITSHGFKFNPIDSNDKPKKEKSLIKTLLERKIPQILASYLIAGTSLILFIEYLVEKYQFPSQYPTLALFALFGILPSVVILAYFHGAPGKDEWTKIEKVGIPINVLFIAGILFFGDSINIWEGDFLFSSGATSPFPSTNIDKQDGMIYGCMDENANNYNPNATNPDRSCQYKKVVTSNAFGQFDEVEIYKSTAYFRIGMTEKEFNIKNPDITEQNDDDEFPIYIENCKDKFTYVDGKALPLPRCEEYTFAFKNDTLESVYRGRNNFNREIDYNQYPNAKP